LVQVDQVAHGQVVVDQEPQLLKELIQFFLQLHHQVVVEVDPEITHLLVDRLEDQVVVEVEPITALHQVDQVILEHFLFQRVMLVELLDQ
tara:strand:- start:227 stop:496 length:270 start_codon:yes stop_codon:yes gene_type:complete